MTQLALIASVPTHALGWGRQKSPAVVAMFVTTSGAVPTFDRMIGLAGLDLPTSIGPKSAPPMANSCTIGATPTPLSTMESGLPPPSFVMTSRPPLGPITLGVKTTPIKHDAPAPKFAGQADVTAKSVGAVGAGSPKPRTPLLTSWQLLDRSGYPTTPFPKSRDGGLRSIG